MNSWKSAPAGACVETPRVLRHPRLASNRNGSKPCFTYSHRDINVSHDDGIADEYRTQSIDYRPSSNDDRSSGTAIDGHGLGAIDERR